MRDANFIFILLVLGFELVLLPLLVALFSMGGGVYNNCPHPRDVHLIGIALSKINKGTALCQKIQ